MILAFLFLVTLIQLILYWLSDLQHLKYGKLVILILILCGHFFVFPEYFFPDTGSEIGHFALPVLGTLLAFWIFGSSIAILMHASYFLFKKLHSDD